MDASYIPPADLASTLRTLGAIEQWLGHSDAPSYRALSWLRIESGPNGDVQVAKFDVFDDGNEDFLDVYEFEAIDPDIPFGDLQEFRELEEALTYASSEWGADDAKYVKGGEIQLIYADFLCAFGPPPELAPPSDSSDS